MDNKIDFIHTQTAIENILAYSQSHGDLLQKYDTSFFINYFDKFTIEELEEKLKGQILTCYSFVRHFACFIPHCPDETLFFIISLIDLFQAIVRQTKSETEITIKDFTSYLCEAISKQDDETIVKRKQIAMQKNCPNALLIRDMDVHPPYITHHESDEAPKISQSVKKKEKKVDPSKPLYIFFYNTLRREIITLGRLASHITIFNMSLNQTRIIHPNCFRLFDKNMAILSMAFSDRQQRIGCIISHIGMAFWDYQDNFQTEKLVKKTVGHSIYYLPLLDQWATTTIETVHFWDLKREQTHFSFGESGSTSINDVKEITHVRCLVVSYTIDNHKWIYVYHNDGMKRASRLKLNHTGAQKIHYNRTTQTILLMGSNELPVYTIDSKSLDLSLIKNLEGHETIITCISDIQGGLVVTGDDRGSLRVWNLTSCRCQQVIRVANCLNQIQCIGRSLIFSDSRLNLMCIEQLTQKTPQCEVYGIRKFYNLHFPRYELFIFTALNCRVYNLTDGRLIRIVQICGGGEEIVVIQRLNEDFLVATTRANLACLSDELNQKWRIQIGDYHSDQVLHIRHDPKNKFIITVGKEGSIYVWNQKSLLEEGPRKSLIQMQKQNPLEIVLFDFSQPYTIMVTAQNIPELKIWDYQSFKLCHVIKLQAVATALKISKNYPLLGVGCLNQKIYLCKVQRKENSFQIQLVHVINLYSNHCMGFFSSNQTNLCSPNEQKLKNFYARDLLFSHSLEHHLLVIAYGKGNLITFSIANIIEVYFRQNTYSKLAINIQRPIRQIIEKQMSKNQFKIMTLSSQLKEEEEVIRVMWDNNLHRDIITDVDIFQEKYLSTLSVDGYYKVVQLSDCQVLCSLSIRYPLPNIWKFQSFQTQELSQKIHKALTIISDIVNDKKQQLQCQDLNIFNVEPFMRQICNYKNTIFLKRQKAIRLLKDQLSPQDLSRSSYKQSKQTLKYLQAYKRVNTIKQTANIRTLHEIQPKKSIGSSMEEKQGLMTLLAPNYFPILCCRKSDQYSIQLKWTKILTKSTNISPTHSKEKLEISKDLKERSSDQSGLLRKINPIKIHHARSVSQCIRPLAKDTMSSFKKEKEDLRVPPKMHQTFQKLSILMKSLNAQVPKDIQTKTHLRKCSTLKKKF